MLEDPVLKVLIIGRYKSSFIQLLILIVSYLYALLTGTDN
jgi:hypothetical protein